MNTSTIGEKSKVLGRKLIGISLFAAAGAIAIAAVAPHLADVGLTRPVFASVQPRVIEITAKKFEFTPSEITLKKGEPVILRLTSSDRVHGFMSKPLKIDTDIPSDTTKDVSVTPTPPATSPSSATTTAAPATAT